MYQYFKEENKFAKKDKKNASKSDYTEEDFALSLRDYYDDLSNIPPITKEEEAELLKDGMTEKAKKRLVEGNLRFVFKVANFYRGSGVPMTDLVSEGNMGLLKAIEKFDTKKECRFYCYALWWIKAKISMYVRKRHVVTAVESYADDCLSATKPDDMEFDDDNADSDLYCDYEETPLPQDDFKSEENEENEETSQDNDDFVSFSCGADSIESYVDGKIIEKERKKLFGNLKAIMTESELRIIQMYFGYGEKKRTLKEISSTLQTPIQSVIKERNSGLSKIKNEIKKSFVLMSTYANQ